MKKIFFLMIALCYTLMFTSCNDDSTPPLPDNVVQFESAALGLSPEENTIPVTITFSRQVEVGGTITISVQPEGLIYGDDFATTPATADGTLSLPLAAGIDELTFAVSKNEQQLFEGTESIVFTITSVPEGLVTGERNQLQLSFAEIIAEGAEMAPNVGGPDQPNKVFVDLSANRQTAVPRNAWDLGFYTEAGEFRVILNSSTDMMARAIDKTDLNAVTATDTLGFAAELNVRAFSPQAMAWIDDPSGDLNETAIEEVSSVAEENQVYIIKRGTNPDGSPRGWKKVRILRAGEGYEIRYADISSDSYQTLTIEKDPEYYFNYLSFDSGAVVVEPAKEKWDIAFTVFMNSTTSQGMSIPYTYNDFVLQNRFGVETALIMEEDGVSYESFAVNDLSGINYETAQNTIGSSWRVTGGPSGAQPGVHEDRFYIVKDADSNIYKLRFTALTQNGERGRPIFEYELLVEGGN